MPRIDSYQANNNIAPVEVVSQDVGLYTHGGQAFSEVAKQVDDIAQKFREIRNVSETAKASTDFAIELDKIKSQAEQDPNYNNLEAYQSKIDEAMNNHLASISEKSVRDKATETFRLNAYNAFDHVQTNFRKRSIEASQYQLVKNIDTEQSNYLGTNDPVKQQQAKDNALAMLDAHVNAGIITAETAKETRRYISINWDKIKQRNIDFENKLEARRIKEAQIKAENAQIKNEADLVESISAGGLDFIGAREVSQMIDNKEIRPEFGEAWLGYISDPSVVEKPMYNNPGFAEHVDAILNAKNRNEVNLAMLDVLRRKDVKTEELGLIIGLSKRRSDALVGTTTDNGIKVGSKQVQIDAMLSEISSWAKSLPEDNSSAVMKDYLTRLNSDNDPLVAFDQAKRAEIVKQFNQAGTWDGKIDIVSDKDYSNIFVNIPGSKKIAPHKIYKE